MLRHCNRAVRANVNIALYIYSVHTYIAIFKIQEHAVLKQFWRGRRCLAVPLFTHGIALLQYITLQIPTLSYPTHIIYNCVFLSTRLETLWNKELESRGQQNASFMRVWLQFFWIPILVMFGVVCFNAALTFVSTVSTLPKQLVSMLFLPHLLYWLTQLIKLI